eukprot:CAMPEP_0204425992 /NCGR_PEP_ID=MMETSP0470-20130426/50976_1 /ASSEMBLY_ACC=CAM_ASM_000385 /TAXON_ID=2969 /ORGANISM="Oxyrrhis marina" /LENGTH=160 /DNA_ID=CAMNT_0051423653 /DNA_START=454 /DNA_END=936 /DNA_ORIENTATION=-
MARDCVPEDLHSLLLCKIIGCQIPKLYHRGPLATGNSATPQARQTAFGQKSVGINCAIETGGQPLRSPLALHLHLDFHAIARSCHELSASSACHPSQHRLPQRERPISIPSKHVFTDSLVHGHTRPGVDEMSLTRGGEPPEEPADTFLLQQVPNHPHNTK